MKKKYKMLLELVKKEETDFGAIGIRESVKTMETLGKTAKKLGFDCYIKGYPKEKLNYKPTGKIYKIKTIEDIVKLTDKQFEFFIDDLREYCNISRGANLLKNIGVEVKTKKGMIWLDTGLNESKINIEINGSNKI